MKFKPKVSVVIPVYNGSDYLREAVDSVLNQTYENIEVIVINDGSTDGGKTEKIAYSYGKTIRYYKKNNGGVSSALNLGIQKMKGEYFSWLSHDDVFYPYKIQKQLDYIINNPKYSAVTGNFDYINKSGKIVGEYRNTSKVVLDEARDIFKIWINGSAILFHKNCFKKIGLFDIKNKTTQDAEMWLRLISKYPIYFLKDKLIKSRHHNKQGSRMNYPALTAGLDYFYEYIINNYDISIFFPKQWKILFNNNRYALTYEWLGDQALLRRSLEGAKKCYSKASEVNRSLLNLSKFKLILCSHGLDKILVTLLLIKNNYSNTKKRMVLLTY
ncbi:MAG: glycosyltransferase [Bacteroidota bacterium]